MPVNYETVLKLNIWKTLYLTINCQLYNEG